MSVGSRSVPAPPSECDVLIIGAGIAGLVTGLRLRRARPDAHIEIVDVATTIGGKLLTGELAGITIDLGAEAVIARRPEGMQLISDLGLRDRVHHPGVGDARIVVGGQQFPVPQDTLMGVPTDVQAIAESGILSAAGAERVRRPEIHQWHEDASVADVVGAQCGPEVVDRIVEPLLGGVYAGRAERLSLAATIPALRSVIGGDGDVVAAARAVRESAPKSDAPVFATVDGGIGSLPAVIAAQAQLNVTLGCPARSITRTADGFEVEVGAAPAPTTIRARSVVVATQPQKATKLLAGVSPDASTELGQVDVSSMAVVAIAYQASKVANLPTGSGILVPVSAGRSVKAATYVSNKWPHLIGDRDLFFVRASIGRIGDDHELQRTDGELIDISQRDLEALVGLQGTPIDARVQRWAGSLPQYDVGHLARVERIRAAIATVPGLAVAGATYDGVGIPGCITSADAAAARILHHLT